jgi:hypothetical protein
MPAEKIPGWRERLLLPKLSEISGDIKAINTRLDSIEKRIPVIEKITALELKIADLEKRLAVA